MVFVAVRQTRSSDELVCELDNVNPAEASAVISVSVDQNKPPVSNCAPNERVVLFDKVLSVCML